VYIRLRRTGQGRERIQRIYIRLYKKKSYRVAMDCGGGGSADDDEK
jgi:hypothetical protein